MSPISIVIFFPIKSPCWSNVTKQQLKVTILPSIKSHGPISIDGLNNHFLRQGRVGIQAQAAPVQAVMPPQGMLLIIFERWHWWHIMFMIFMWWKLHPKVICWWFLSDDMQRCKKRLHYSWLWISQPNLQADLAIRGEACLPIYIAHWMKTWQALHHARKIPMETVAK